MRLSKILNYQLGNLPTGDILKNQRVVIAVDGGRTKIRINFEGDKNPKTNRYGFADCCQYGGSAIARNWVHLTKSHCSRSKNRLSHQLNVKKYFANSVECYSHPNLLFDTEIFV